MFGPADVSSGQRRTAHSSVQGLTTNVKHRQFDPVPSLTDFNMAGGVQLGLEVAFYLYPCGLFATLLGSQSVQYYRERHGKPNRDATADEKQADATRRFYARLIWGFQLVLSLLLVGPHMAHLMQMPPQP